MSCGTVAHQEWKNGLRKMLAGFQAFVVVEWGKSRELPGMPDAYRCLSKPEHLSFQKVLAVANYRGTG